LAEGLPDLFSSGKQSEQKIKIDWHQYFHYVRYLALLLLTVNLVRIPWQGDREASAVSEIQGQVRI